MGLFDIFKKQQVTEAEQQNNDILLTMPLFGGNERYHLEAVINDIKATWDIDTTDFEGDNDAAAFKLNGLTVMLAYISSPIPGEEIELTAEYAYNWPSALSDLKNYSGHALLSIILNKAKPVEGFKLMSMILSSILRTSNAIGVYNGEQSLLIPSRQFLDIVEILKEGELPITLWVYIGIRPSENGNSVYTYGLKTFNKKEIEIIDSQLMLKSCLT